MEKKLSTKKPTSREETGAVWNRGARSTSTPTDLADLPILLDRKSDLAELGRMLAQLRRGR